MKCFFCNNELSKPSVYSAHRIVLCRRHPHTVKYLFNSNFELNSVSFDTKMNQRNWQITYWPKNSRLWLGSRATTYLHAITALSIEYKSMTITPENIDNKLKTYLVFS